MGWWISIDHETNGSRLHLACWEEGAYDWVDTLANEGKLKQVQKGGYPNMYLATASDILPLLADVKETYPGEIFKKRSENIETCPPDAELRIALWDQS